MDKKPIPVVIIANSEREAREIAFAFRDEIQCIIYYSDCLRILCNTQKKRYESLQSPLNTELWGDLEELFTSQIVAFNEMINTLPEPPAPITGGTN